jgi:hypothetical protein
MSADLASQFSMGGEGEEASRDGSTVLLTEKKAFRNFVRPHTHSYYHL